MDLDRAIFLVVDSAKSQAVARAWERFDSAAVLEVALFYRPSTDVALVAVHLVPGDARGRWIGEVVASGLAVIDPGRMGEGDRKAFFASYLGAYQRLGEPQAGVAAAMVILAPSVRGKAAARGTGPARALAEVPSRRAASEPPPLPPLPPRGDPTRSTSRGLGAVREPGDVPELPPLGVPALSEGSGRARAPTVNLRGERPSGRGSGGAGPVAAGSRPGTGERPALPLTARFVRGGQWSPARLRSLSARGAYLVTGAPPRPDDDVYVAIDLGDRSALVRGRVYHVTTARDAAATGSAGFAVRFDTAPSAARGRLLELLHAARAAGVVIRPPPARAAMRFPVRWPVTLGGEVSDALDLSLGGMFVAALDLAVDQALAVTVSLDDGPPPLVVATRVARVVSAGEAVARGLVAGAGLRLEPLAEPARERWAQFLGRIERRSGRTVVVGAGLARLEAITRALTDAGYAVAPCADPGALLRTAEGGAAPDAAIIDDSLLGHGVAPQWLEQLFSARQVPCITMRGEVGRARAVVDRLLSVGAR
jgi:hypothetical protein